MRILLLILFMPIFLVGCIEDKGAGMSDKQSDKGKGAGGYESGNLKEAMFGAGCFWGVQAKFDSVDGVVETEVGYAGGESAAPSYKEVCSGKTGHAEVVHLLYDPAAVSYEALLDVFWGMHDPTTLNRQGPDVGSQYRSVIFYYDEGQKTAALASKERLNESGKHSSDIVTEVAEGGKFWRGEDYHQKYLEKRGVVSCHK
jgi:peptide-methionine (S)-S-oxide reductase